MKPKIRKWEEFIAERIPLAELQEIKAAAEKESQDLDAFRNSRL